MAQLATSFVQACCKGFNESHLTRAISFEAERGHCNTFGRTMRFSNFLHSKLLKWCSRSNHGSSQKLLEEVGDYSTASTSERSKFLNKISVFMGYNNIQDLVAQERDRRQSTTDANDVYEEFDFSLTCGRFPCIKLGDSSLVGLYDEVPHAEEQENLLPPESCDKYLSTSGANWEKCSKLVGTWYSVRPPPTETNPSSPMEDNSFVVQLDSREADSDVEGKVEEQETSKNLLESSSTESVLDRAIRSLPGTTSRQCCQLEGGGFYTVRKLLHHFPHTYSDLLNPLETIEEGRYVMLVGIILSSRGIRAGKSFSFLEVVVGCEFQKNEEDSKIEDDYGTEDKKMIYLHLKKFFRGTRFTYQPFLRSIESKYTEGDCLHVSG